VVAFATTSLLGLLGCLAVWLYGKRRPVGAPLTWGEAMAASTFVFLMFFWFYGVIPHYWLEWADSELNWRSDTYLVQTGQALFGQQWLSWWPLDVTLVALRDVIATVVYGVGLGLHIMLWMVWQNRAKERPAVVPASRYGRPLVRKG
jgi:hypothetical protein